MADDVFIGPNVTFANNKLPRSKQYPKYFFRVQIDKNASIGAGEVILPDVTIGKYAMVGAGIVVTKYVPPYAVVVGNPARVTRYLDINDKFNV